MIDKTPPSKPYIVDIEHAASLTGFTPDDSRVKSVKKFLADKNCKSITCLSMAAKRTLKELLGKDYAAVKDKVDVIYPALEEVTSTKPDYEFISSNKSRLKLLFVGNQAYLKGLEETLEALSRIDANHPGKIELHIVSDDASELVNKYKLPNVYLYKPAYTRPDILSKFFLPADVFIMPTKEDTFGMAVLDSLACGTPVITTRQFALPELVADGIDGILLHINNPILDRTIVPDKEGMRAITSSNIDESLAEEIETVLTNILAGKINLRKMGENGKKKFASDSQFSVWQRNRKLLSIYRDYLSATTI